MATGNTFKNRIPSNAPADLLLRYDVIPSTLGSSFDENIDVTHVADNVTSIEMPPVICMIAMRRLQQLH